MLQTDIALSSCAAAHTEGHARRLMTSCENLEVWSAMCTLLYGICTRARAVESGSGAGGCWRRRWAWLRPGSCGWHWCRAAALLSCCFWLAACGRCMGCLLSTTAGATSAAATTAASAATTWRRRHRQQRQQQPQHHREQQLLSSGSSSCRGNNNSSSCFSNGSGGGNNRSSNS